jgi:putative endonuclease
LYLLECQGEKTYVGTTKNVYNRFERHCTGNGAHFTRIYKPIRVLAAQPFPDQSSACKAEYALKKLPVNKKRLWAEKWPWSES